MNKLESTRTVDSSLFILLFYLESTRTVDSSLPYK
jgi:hypothetical protein